MDIIIFNVIMFKAQDFLSVAQHHPIFLTLYLYYLKLLRYCYSKFHYPIGVRYMECPLQFGLVNMFTHRLYNCLLSMNQLLGLPDITLFTPFLELL